MIVYISSDCAKIDSFHSFPQFSKSYKHTSYSESIVKPLYLETSGKLMLSNGEFLVQHRTTCSIIIQPSIHGIFHCFPLFSTVFHCSTALNHGEKPPFFTTEALRASPTGAVPGGAGPSRRRGAKGAAATAALGVAT